MDETTGVIIFVVLLILFTRVAAHFLDKDRIRTAAMLKNWTNVDVTWSPFASGWIFETKERFYTVTFKDKSGKSHELLCKTSMLMGVSWIDNDIRGI